MATIRGPYLIDTSVLIYATLEADPRAAAARRVIEHGRDGRHQAFVSVQNLAEMYPNLTGPKKQPPDTPAQAREKIAAIAALPYLHILPVTVSIIHKALELADRDQVRRQRFFDAQLAATLVIHDIPTLITENTEDFAAIPRLRVVNPFR